MKRLASLGDLAALIPQNATVVVHSACAEPGDLIAALVAQAGQLQGVTLLTLMPMGRPAYADPKLSRNIAVKTFFPGKGLRSAVQDGRAVLLRHTLHEISTLFRSGSMKADVLLLQVSPPDEEGRCSLGIAVDYMPDVLARRLVVIAAVNASVPRTCGASSISAAAIDWFIESISPVQTVAPAEIEQADAIEASIADHAASLVRDGDILQIGIGALPDMVLARLAHCRDLGLHTGIITDSIRPLVDRGVITNARKARFAGVSVTTMAAGTAAFYAYLHGNEAFSFQPCSVTHDAAWLAGAEGFTAINSVLEIDLNGCATAECIDGRILSAPGGLPDFASAAAHGERSIVALRSTSKDGSISRIRATLRKETPVTLLPGQINFVITEHGVAQLTGLGAAARARALTAIAHPEFRRSIAEVYAAG
jgi:4-hydroxybutyrate CoA-transferase